MYHKMGTGDFSDNSSASKSFETQAHDLDTNSAGAGCKEFKRPFDLSPIVFHASTSPMIFLFFWRGQ